MALGTGTAVRRHGRSPPKWIETEFQPSTLSKEDQLKEMEWFVNAAKPFPGMEINVVSETITTHEYEAQDARQGVQEITGIKVNHDLIQEGDVVEKIQTQMQSGKNIYDGWINDSDLIGTHFRYKQAIALYRLDDRRGQRRDFADTRRDDFIGGPSARAPTARSTSCLTSSSRTYTGSATTGSSDLSPRTSSKRNTAMNSAFRLTGRHMRISPSSSPTM